MWMSLSPRSFVAVGRGAVCVGGWLARDDGWMRIYSSRRRTVNRAAWPMRCWSTLLRIVSTSTWREDRRCIVRFTTFSGDSRRPPCWRFNGVGVSSSRSCVSTTVFRRLDMDDMQSPSGALAWIPTRPFFRESARSTGCDSSRSGTSSGRSIALAS